MRKSQLLAQIFYHGGGAKALNLLQGTERLTVLAYHRVLDFEPSEYTYFAPNVSATTPMFRQQLDFVRRNFNVIDLAALLAYLRDDEPLPPRPLLITFDDGYLDNYENAAPVLQEYQLPAVIFLTTGRMEEPGPLWWDLCAYYFYAAGTTSTDLPLVGTCSFETPAERLAVCQSVAEALKTLSETDRRQALRDIRQALAAPSHPPANPPLFMSWDHVRELVQSGIACQPHTVTHPILTRTSHEEVYHELATSKAQIEAETSQPALALAYPNGQPGDYDRETLRILRELGYQAAFTLVPGPMPFHEARRHPLEIRRVFLGYRDTFEIFVAKVMGLPSLLTRVTYMEE
jgi:peptidoglycan/xylan/chitin deacetylase (PgdA/CDA1 family)